ncbi:MAG TPA: hypothetical protein VKM55_24375 [Candidatus Lokiarchaeia archaeon]|nr:hypothetical protein [Candidatus Lokiarchaeia archaeon]
MKWQESAQAFIADIEMDGKCPCCREPLLDVEASMICMLNSDCCATCIARCMAVDQCGLIADPAFWEKYEIYRSKIGTYWVKDGKKMPFHS